MLFDSFFGAQFEILYIFLIFLTSKEANVILVSFGGTRSPLFFCEGL